MTYQSVRMSDLYCDGCGLGLLLAPQQDETAVTLRAMAREDGWTVRRKERNCLGNLVGTLDLCGECSTQPAERTTGNETC